MKQKKNSVCGASQGPTERRTGESHAKSMCSSLSSLDRLLQVIYCVSLVRSQDRRLISMPFCHPFHMVLSHHHRRGDEWRRNNKNCTGFKMQRYPVNYYQICLLHISPPPSHLPRVSHFNQHQQYEEEHIAIPTRLQEIWHHIKWACLGWGWKGMPILISGSCHRITSTSSYWWTFGYSSNKLFFFSSWWEDFGSVSCGLIHQGDEESLTIVGYQSVRVSGGWEGVNFSGQSL